MASSAPSLPTEIWESIFNAAAGGRGASAPLLRFPHYHHLNHDLEQRNVRQGIATKLRILQVCKDWRDLVEPALYSHLVLKQFSSLNTLIRTLSGTSETNGKKRAELVNRLDILAPVESDNPREPRILRQLSQLRALFTLLLNLESLVVRNTFSYEDSRALVQSNFLASISATLKSISWIDEKCDYSLVRLPASIWTPFLDSHPNLQSIQRPKVDVPAEAYDIEPEISLLSKPMSKVTQMVLRLEWTLSRSDLYLLDTGDGQDTYPNLRHLLFQMPIIGPMDMEMMGGVVPVPTMLAIHGHKITSMDCAFHKVLSQDSPQQQFFPMIAMHCPNLEEFGLFFNWNNRSNDDRWEEQAVWSFNLPREFPRVKKLKVMRMNRKFDLAAYQEMLRFVRAVVIEDKTLPNCKIVQFVSERDFIYFSRRKDLLARGLESLSTPGVTLLDHRGLEFVPD